MFGLGHVDFTPVVYGAIIFIGLWSMLHKWHNGNIGALLTEIAVFFLVFKLHGGTMAGGFAAAVAALLAGTIFPRIFR